MDFRSLFEEKEKELVGICERQIEFFHQQVLHSSLPPWATRHQKSDVLIEGFFLVAGLHDFCEFIHFLTHRVADSCEAADPIDGSDTAPDVLKYEHRERASFAADRLSRFLLLAPCELLWTKCRHASTERIMNNLFTPSHPCKRQSDHIVICIVPTRLANLIRFWNETATSRI